MVLPITMAAVPEDWQRALTVVAHPDDPEYGLAAAVARWTGQGKRIAYCLSTSGEAGIDSLPPEQAGPVREAEQRAAAAVVGVSEVEFLGLPDGTIEYGLPLRRAIAAAIRRHRPDVVLGLSHRDGDGPPNQADHVAVGRALIDAARDAGNRWVFRDLLDAGLEPWPGVEAVLMAGSPRPTHAVDVSATFDRGVASLREHRAYLEGLGAQGGESVAFLEDRARQAGARLGVPFAVELERIRLGS